MSLYQVDALMKHRSEIPVVMQFHHDILTLWEPGVSDGAYWLNAHPECDVVIEDEYGKVVAE